jgi:thiosulfate dehydrogenase (quinone)
VTASLLDAHMTPVAHWDTATLSNMPKTAFVNDYDYNKFGPGPFGIRAPLGAAATITLPPSASAAPQGAAYLQLTDVDGQSFSAPLER